MVGAISRSHDKSISQKGKKTKRRPFEDTPGEQQTAHPPRTTPHTKTRFRASLKAIYWLLIYALLRTCHPNDAPFARWTLFRLKTKNKKSWGF